MKHKNLSQRKPTKFRKYKQTKPKYVTRELRAGTQQAQVGYFDGGSRGNPGSSGWGAWLDFGNKTIEQSGYLGVATVNVAEYSGLIGLLECAVNKGVRELTVYGDSSLIINQMNGRWRVKHPSLIPLYTQACGLAASIPLVSFVYVPRDYNKNADRLANLAMDMRSSHGPIELQKKEFPTVMSETSQVPCVQVGVKTLRHSVPLPKPPHPARRHSTWPFARMSLLTPASWRYCPQG